MSVINEKREELDSIQTAKFIAATLRDISAIQMRSIRDSFKSNRSFYVEISELYSLVKLHAARVQYDHKTRTLDANTPSTLAVAITSNKRFYGSLNGDVIETFFEYIEEQPQADLLIVGDTGSRYVKRSIYAEKCKTLAFEDDDPTVDEMNFLLSATSKYEKVLVFYPRFVSVFKQEPAILDITYTPTPEKVTEESIEGYIFEPDIGEMLTFFEDRIKHLLLNRTMLETKLARTAARLMKMNSAEHRASDMIEDKERELRKEVSALSNLRLLETFSGLSKWRRH